MIFLISVLSSGILLPLAVVEICRGIMVLCVLDFVMLVNLCLWFTKRIKRLMSAVVDSCSKYGQLRNNSYSSLLQNVAEEAGNTLFLHV